MSCTDLSAKLFADACELIPGGVNSPVRAFSAVGGTPRFLTSGQGCWLTDVDGNRYVDLVCSWGPMILGHAHPAVVEAVSQAAARGLSFGAPTPVRSNWPPRSSAGSPRSNRSGWSTPAPRRR